MANSLLSLISKKLQESADGRLPLRIRADEEDKEKIKAALEDAGIDPDDIEEMEDGLTVKAVDDMKDTVQEICKKYECGCGESDDDDEVDEDDDEYTSDNDAEVKKNSTIGEEDDDDETDEEEDDETDEEDDEDDKTDEEDDEDGKTDEEDDDETDEEEDDETDEEDDEDDKTDEEETDPEQVSHDKGTQKAHPSEEEEDDDVDEEDDEDDETDEEDDEDDKTDEEEDDECAECDDEEEMKECIQNRVREDIRTIAKNLKINEDVLSQVETSFIAALERRARSIAKQYAKRDVRKIKNEARREIRKINNNVNKYLTYAAKEWVNENRVKIDNKLKVKLAEDIINNIKKTLVENEITVPSVNKTLKKYSKMISKLQNDLNEAKVQNIRQAKQLDSLKSAIIIDEVGEMYGLSENQKENFQSVVNDSLDFSSMTPKEFYKHAKVMAEMYVGGKKVLKEESKVSSKKANKPLSRKEIYMKYLGQDKF